MRVLHVVASYLPAVRYGGPIVSVHGLCRALAARGHDVHVFTTSVDGPQDSDVPHGAPTLLDGVKVWYFRSTQFRRLYWAPAMAAALDAQIAGFDVVHTHAVYLWPNAAAIARARRSGVPYVMSPRGMLEKDLIDKRSPLWKALLIGFFERRYLEGAAVVHVTSRREAEELSRFGFNLRSVVEIPNGVDTAGADLSRPPSPAVADILQRGPFVLFIGRVNWKKGLDRLLAALALAPQVRLVVAGNDEDHYQHQLEAQAARLGIADRVCFTGGVRAADKTALLRASQFLVLPSYSENFGNVVMEALAVERAVLLTPEVGIAPAVAEHGAGLVVAGTPAALAAGLVSLAADAARRDEMGRRGRELVDRRFRWSAVASEMEHVYQSICRTAG